MVSASELVERSGITYRQVDYWTTRGLFVVDCDSPGEGRRRDYPDHEVEVATLVGQLTKAGIEPAVAFYVARDLIDYGESDLDGGFHITLSSATVGAGKTPPWLRDKVRRDDGVLSSKSSAS